MLVFKHSITTPECDTHKSIKLKTNATNLLAKQDVIKNIKKTT